MAVGLLERVGTSVVVDTVFSVGEALATTPEQARADINTAIDRRLEQATNSTLLYGLEKFPYPETASPIKLMGFYAVFAGLRKLEQIRGIER